MNWGVFLESSAFFFFLRRQQTNFSCLCSLASALLLEGAMIELGVLEFRWRLLWSFQVNVDGLSGRSSARGRVDDDDDEEEAEKEGVVGREGGRGREGRDRFVVLVS